LAVANHALAALRAEGYEALLTRFLNSSELTEVTGASGRTYQVEVQGFWDSGEPGDLRVRAAVDDGGIRAFSPRVRDFIIAPDGKFVGE
jgi:hypothetical protein